MKKQNIKQVLKNNGFIIYPIKGTSMLPLLEEVSDRVHLVKCDEFKLFDVVLFETSKGHFVLHRIIDIKDDKYFIIGDNSFILDIKTKDQLLAKMVGIYKGDKYINLGDEFYTSYLSNFIYSDSFNRKQVVVNPSKFFFNRKKEAYYEIIKLAVNEKLDPSKINKLTISEKYKFVEYSLWKKAGPYLGLAISKYGVDLSESLNKKLIQEYESNKMRYLRAENAISKLDEVLEKAQIPHTFLKGSETKKLYPSPYLRVANDIDLLIAPEYYDKAQNIIINDLNGKFYASTPHDNSYVIESLKMDIELHHHINTDIPSDLKWIIEDPLKNGSLVKGYKYRYRLSNKDMMVIALSHAGKHLNGGEFWITMLLDIYFLSKKGFNKEILKTSRLEDFYNNIMKYLDHILLNTSLDDSLLDFEEYLFKDKYDAYIALTKGKYQNKFLYILKRIWVPYRYLTPTHPLLKKLPILLPIYEMGRWLRLIFKKGKFKKGMTELNAYLNQNEKEINVLKNAGLSEYIVRYEDQNGRF